MSAFTSINFVKLIEKISKGEDNLKINWPLNNTLPSNPTTTPLVMSPTPMAQHEDNEHIGKESF